jgi:dynein heavy chain
VALLRDVKYLEQQDRPDRELPSSAANVFQQSETYRQYLQNLDVVVALYNSVRDTILDVEYPLIEQQLQDIDKQLEKAIAEINWTSSGKFFAGGFLIWHIIGAKTRIIPVLWV